MRIHESSLIRYFVAAVTGFFLGKLLPVDGFRHDPGNEKGPGESREERVTDTMGSPPESVANTALAAEWKWYGSVQAAAPGDLPALALKTAAIEESGMRAEMRRLVMDRWLESEPAAALQWATAENSRRDYFDSLFEAWAARDRDGAIAAADALDNPGRRRNAYREICIEFANSNDPAGFLSWASGIEPALIHPGFFGSAVANLARDDLEKARRMTGEIRDDSARTESIEALAEAWGDSDPKAVLNWAATLENRDDADQAVAAILPKVAASDPDLVRTELRKLQDPRLNRESIVRKVLEELTRSDPVAGVRWLKEFASSDSRYHNGIIRTAVKSGPAAAMKAMDAIGEWEPHSVGGGFPHPDDPFAYRTEPDLSFVHGDPGEFVADADYLPGFVADVDSLPGKPGSKATLRRSVVTLWAHKDFPKAWEYASAFPDPEERLKLMKAVMKQPNDWLAAWEKSETLPESIRPTIQGHLMNNIKHGNLEQAVTLYQGLPGERQDASLASDLAFRLSDHGMARAVAFAESLPPENSRGAWNRVIDAWSFKDPAGLSEWASRLDPGSVRDEAAGKLAETLRADDPEAAFAWAADIGNPTTRSSQLDSVFQEWTRNDPGAAEVFLQETELVSAEQREKLRQVVGEQSGNSVPNPNPRSRP